MIDLGSTSFHLVHARLQDGHVHELFDHALMVRLGETAFRSGHIDARGWERAMDAVADLHRIACTTTSPIVAVATSVFREASNGRAFLAAVHERLGFSVDLLSEEAEAELCFRGAMTGTSASQRAVVIDIGGGSIELAAGDAARPQIARSFPCGVLRLAISCLGDGRMLRSAGARMIQQSVSEAIAPMIRDVRRLRPERIVLTGGTSRLLAKLCSSACGRCEINRVQLSALIGWLDGRTPAMLIADGMPSARADTIGTGAVIVATLLDLLDVTTAQVAKSGLREGILAREASTITSR